MENNLQNLQDDPTIKHFLKLRFTLLIKSLSSLQLVHKNFAHEKNLIKN